MVQRMVLDPARFHTDHGGFVLFGVQLPAKQETCFQTIADHPNIQSVMARLLGGSVRRYTDQALIKHKAVRGESFYHQDSDYWYIPPERGANAWIALAEIDCGAIALAILPDTQKVWEIQPHEAYHDEPSLHNAKTGQCQNGTGFQALSHSD